MSIPKTWDDTVGKQIREALLGQQTTGNALPKSEAEVGSFDPASLGPHSNTGLVFGPQNPIQPISPMDNSWNDRVNELQQELWDKFNQRPENEYEDDEKDASIIKAVKKALNRKMRVGRPRRAKDDVFNGNYGSGYDPLQIRSGDGNAAVSGVNSNDVQLSSDEVFISGDHSNVNDDTQVNKDLADAIFNSWTSGNANI